MKTRLVGAALALLLATAAAAGCAPTPEPAEPAPGFTSEAEAFAAAEETYRAYVDALNQVDLSDPETFEEVFAWTTGDANANERKTLSAMHADGWVVSGRTEIASFSGEKSVVAPNYAVYALVCSDVRGVEVRDADGNSVVSTERPDIYALEVVFVQQAQSPTSLAISSSNAVADESCISD